MYGDLIHHQRQALLDELHTTLHTYSDYVIIGDINQLDNYYKDKFGGNPMIQGWEAITKWKYMLNLQTLGQVMTV